MSTYRLTATLEGRTQTITYHADDVADAYMTGIHHVLACAYANKAGPWAVGEITLQDDTNEVLAVMPAKTRDHATAR